MGKGKNQAKTKGITKQAGGFAIARDWLVHEVLVSQNWQIADALITILIARRSPKSGKVAVAFLLIDLGCLGVKSAQVQLYKTTIEYQQGLRAHALKVQPLTPASLNLAAKIIFTGAEYAAQLGFKPDPVYAQAAYLLADADPEAEPTPVTTGKDGKPFYVNGPYDDPQKIIQQLTRAVGVGNFHYFLQGGYDDLDFFDENVEYIEDVEAIEETPSLPAPNSTKEL